MVNDESGRLLVVLGEGETVVAPLLVLEDKAAAVDDLLIGDECQFLRIISGKLRHRSDKKAEHGNALLAIDGKKLIHARGAKFPAQYHDHGARKVRTGASSPNVHNVIPGPSLLLVSRVGSLTGGMTIRWLAEVSKLTIGCGPAFISSSSKLLINVMTHYPQPKQRLRITVSLKVYRH